MTQTQNYKLKKPAGSDFVGPEPYNENMDTIDKELKALKDGSDSVKGAPVLNDLPADSDYVAISDTSDGGKTKRVLWSRIKAFFTNAGNITSGVLNPDRVPMLTDTERMVATIGVCGYNESMATNDVKSYTLPFSKTLDHIPKRIFLRIYGTISDVGHQPGTNLHVHHGDSNTEMELMYNAAENRFDAYVTAVHSVKVGGVIQKSRVTVYWLDVGAQLCHKVSSGALSIDSDTVLTCTVPKDSSPGEYPWTGFGGASFMGEGTSPVKAYMGEISYDTAGVHLKIAVTSGSQYTALGAEGFVFD